MTAPMTVAANEGDTTALSAAAMECRLQYGTCTRRADHGHSSPHTDPVDGSHYCTNYDCHAHPRPDGDSYADGYSGSHTSPVADSHPYAGGDCNTHSKAHEPPDQPSAMWRGITVTPEHRCSDYEAKYYPYPQSVEPKIVEAQGSIYGPYTDTWFDSIRDTDIEHIVARSEAHDSGLCAADPDTKDEFASDPINLTLASPSVNRYQKVDKDAAEWLPGPEPVLVRGTHHRSPPGVRPHHRPRRGGRYRRDPGRVRVNRYDRAGAKNIGNDGNTHSRP